MPKIIPRRISLKIKAGFRERSGSVFPVSYTHLDVYKRQIQDYITMPALPYYLWGITDIIQIDSLDETDSYRKCAKLHKGVLKLYGMLYPERLSGDGENTIFYAPMEYKEYLVKA